MMNHDEGTPNTSGNRPLQAILASGKTRRQILAGGMGAAAMSFFGPSHLLAANEIAKRGSRGKPHAEDLVSFTPVPVAGGGGTVPRVAAEYQFDVILPWGDPIAPDSAEQIGIGHDGMCWFPLRDGNTHGLLVVNHEFGDNNIVIGEDQPEDVHDVVTSQYAHGVSVVELQRMNGQWHTTNAGGYARRIHVNSPVAFSGPVAASPLLQNPAGNRPRGAVNNCSQGSTPWGTYLTCEENFNGYFGATGSWTPTAAQQRYGFNANGAGYGWHLFDERFDLSNPDYVNEDKRFGWVVEIDPWNPDAVPVKRTALGRFKHEGIAITTGRGGRVVGYMGDDERHDYIYKFVSERNWKSMRARGQSPLDHGQAVRRALQRRRLRRLA